jgi:uncharacterized membrane protein YfcA
MDTWFFVAAFFAEIVGTLAGFGSSTILLPIAVLFFDFKTALVLVAFMHLFGNLGRITFFRKGLVWRVIIYFGVIGVAGTLLGALLVSRIDQSLLKALLGVFLVAYALFVLVKPSFSMKPTKLNMLSGGVSSGFLAGLIGTGGALRSAFLTAYNLPKTQYVSTAAAIAIAVDGARIPLYIKDGLLATSYYWMLPILLVLAFAGSYAGKRLVTKIPQGVFSRVVLVCLLLAGAKLVADYFLA